MILDLYKLSAPDPAQAAVRQVLIAEQIKSLGDKYLLAKPVARIER
jgi:hypothetical protein